MNMSELTRGLSMFKFMFVVASSFNFSPLGLFVNIDKACKFSLISNIMYWCTDIAWERF